MNDLTDGEWRDLYESLRRDFDELQRHADDLEEKLEKITGYNNALRGTVARLNNDIREWHARWRGVQAANVVMQYRDGEDNAARSRRITSEEVPYDESQPKLREAWIAGWKLVDGIRQNEQFRLGAHPKP